MSDETTLHEAALAYARNDYPVFPVKPREKQPITPRGFHDGVTDEKIINKWWFDHPTANIGLVTGASGLIVVDVDGEEGEASLKKLVDEHGPPPLTREVKSANGRHIYFKAPSVMLRSSVGALGKNLDIRAHGGYIIAPPSIHPSGIKYRWKGNGAKTFAMMPDWLVDLCACKRTYHASPTPFQVSEIIPEGKRNQAIAQLSGLLLAKKVRPYLSHDLCQGYNLLKCDPPLPADEVTRIVESIAKSELDKTGITP